MFSSGGNLAEGSVTPKARRVTGRTPGWWGPQSLKISFSFAWQRRDGIHMSPGASQYSLPGLQPSSEFMWSHSDWGPAWSQPGLCSSAKRLLLVAL